MLHSLFIGIDFYHRNRLNTKKGESSYASLQGCVNDVKRVAAVLKERIGGPPPVMLLSPNDASGAPLEPGAQWATAANMRAAFAGLIDRAQTGDSVYVHYSGHGGRVITLSEYAGLKSDYDEALVPMDIGGGPGIVAANYIRDVELAGIITALARKVEAGASGGGSITLVFDSCHSGGTTRGVAPMAVRGATGGLPDDGDPWGTLDRTPADPSVPPPRALVEGARAWKALADAAVSHRGAGADTKWLPPSGSYVLLAACRDTELAIEAGVDDRPRCGVMTDAFLEALSSCTGRPPWGAIHERVLARVRARFPSQTPQLLGNPAREVFGAELKEVPPTAPVLHVERGERKVLIGSGLATTIGPGTEFALYKYGTTDFSSEVQRVGTATVTNALPAECWASLAAADDPSRIEEGAPAVVLRMPLQRKVALLVRDDLLPEAAKVQAPALAAVSAALKKAAGGLLVVAQAGETPEYHVVINKLGEYELWNGSGEAYPYMKPVVTPGAPRVQADKAAAEIVDRLQRLARYHNVQEMVSPPSELDGTVDVKLLEPPAEWKLGDPPDRLSPVPQQGATYLLKSDSRYVFSVYNRASFALPHRDLDSARVRQHHGPVQGVPGGGQRTIPVLVPAAHRRAVQQPRRRTGRRPQRAGCIDRFAGRYRGHQPSHARAGLARSRVDGAHVPRGGEMNSDSRSDTMPTTEAADPARPTEAAPLRETRNARRVSPPGGNRPEHCWAFLVGISEYKFAGPSLRKLNFAALDAAGVADVLKRPSCGDVSAERMKLLRDGEATRDRVVGDLREFLRGPAAGDLVILYFACHGMPDPDPQRSHLVYLVAHDTDVTQIGRTGILMREILDSVSDFLASPQRVILICDTCYSGALLQPRTGTRGVDDETERAATVSRFFEQVGASRPGTSVLASAGARQEAYEGKEWDGHGLFTYYLLKGLSGEADTRPTDGRVTIDKLFSYVKEKVAEETKNVQRPVGEAADPDLLIAYVAGLAANDQLEIGRQILQMGLLLDDKGRYRAAAGELEAALQFAADLGSSLPEAGQLLGRAKLMAGDAAGAVRLLADAAARDREGRLPALQYELGLAQVMTGDGASAAETLRGFAARFPGDEHAQWAETLAGWQERAPMARRRALLVGVQTYEHPPGPLPDGSRLMELMGPVKDVRLMQATLIEVCGFAPEDIRVFTDGAATHESVLAELRDLTEEAGPADTILVYLSGNGAVRPQDDYALALFDAVQPPLGLVKSLTALELHQALEPIKTTNKLLIVDACTNDLLLRQLMQATTYAALLGARPGDRALDTAFDAQGEKVNSGLFTYALVQRLRRDGPHVPRRRLLEGIIADIWSREPQQTPILVGASNLPFLPQDPSASMQRLIEFSFRRHYGPFAAADIAALYDASLIDLEAVPFPELHLSAGRAYLGVGEHRRSLEALERARVETNSPCAELLAPLAAARVQAGRFDGGKAAWDSLAQAVGTLEDKARDLEAVLRRLRTPSRRALVVGIEGYAGPAMEGVRTQGAAADADDVRGLLASEGGFEVLVLPPEKATRAVLMDEFEKLCLAARTGPAVFYFAGAGSHEDGMPTLVSVDGRTEGVFDIRLDDLARIAGSDLPNLVVVLDTCFDPEAQPAFRAVARDLRPRPQRRDIGVPEPVKLTVPSVGAATLFHREGIVSVIGNPDSRAAIEAALALRFPQHVVSAQSLAQRLKSSDVAQAGAAGGASRFIAELACDRTGQKQIEAMLQREERRPIANAATLLGRLIEKRKNQDPDGLVSRAVAYSLTGELDAALRDLESAFSQYGADARATEAHYHFGRILIEQGLNPERAVSELEQVVKYDPDHAGARYCLGLAIRQMIERKYNELIREHWQRYLDLGAPLGHADEVTAYLRPPPPPQPLSR